ncbi:SRPBCC family protein [Hydrocarboniphaga sp.]|uniref:SRPBCC family protein n=1 Tax=Hydrocarboniphaga sp. TaxID=2033016 RepID=UPI003D0F41E0
MITDKKAGDFVISRDFPLPRERVWKAWSDAAELRQWWGPKGCVLDLLRFEFKAGGLAHYAMRFDGAPPMWGRFNYRDISAPERLVWLNSFANEHGGIARAPFSEDCPLEIENEVTFTGHGGLTTITLRARPFGATAAEQAYFEQLHESLAEGYGGTFDQLSAHLA